MKTSVVLGLVGLSALTGIGAYGLPGLSKQECGYGVTMDPNGRTGPYGWVCRNVTPSIPQPKQPAKMGAKEVYVLSQPVKSTSKPVSATTGAICASLPWNASSQRKNLGCSY